jgi:hypothetical protein
VEAHVRTLGLTLFLNFTQAIDPLFGQAKLGRLM